MKTYDKYTFNTRDAGYGGEQSGNRAEALAYARMYDGNVRIRFRKSSDHDAQVIVPIRGKRGGVVAISKHE